MIIILLAITIFIDFIIKSKNNAKYLSEIEEQGRQVMQIMSQNIRQADSITVPAAGVSSSTTTIKMVTPAIDPTSFTLAGGKIQIRQGAGLYTDLTNSEVNVTSLNFTNVSASSTPGAIKVQFTLTAGSFSKNFYATYSLR